MKYFLVPGAIHGSIRLAASRIDLNRSDGLEFRLALRNVDVDLRNVCLRRLLPYGKLLLIEVAFSWVLGVGRMQAAIMAGTSQHSESRTGTT